MIGSCVLCCLLVIAGMNGSIYLLFMFWPGWVYVLSLQVSCFVIFWSLEFVLHVLAALGLLLVVLLWVGCGL